MHEDKLDNIMKQLVDLKGEMKDGFSRMDEGFEARIEKHLNLPEYVHAGEE